MENSSTGTPWYADSGSNKAATAGANTEKPLMEQAKEQTQRVIGQTQQKAGEAIEQVRGQVVTQLEGQKDRATGGMETVALALRQTGQHLREQDQEAMSGYAESAADAVERFSGYLSRRDVGQMIGEVEGFARRQPTLFLGSTFALGLLAGRFLKSSSPGDGAMPSGGSPAPHAGESYQSEMPKRSDEAGVARPTVASATGGGAATTVRSEVGNPGRPSKSSGSTPAGTTAMSSPSTTLDAEDDGDLVTTTVPQSTRSKTRGEGQP